MRDIFAAEPKLTRHFFSMEGDHARAMNELAGLETCVSFFFLFSLMFVYQAKNKYSTAFTTNH